MSSTKSSRDPMSIAVPGSLLLIGAVTAYMFVSRMDAPKPHAPPKAAVTAETATNAKRYKIPVTSSQPSKGNPDALVTLVEWNDLRCATCAQTEPILDALMKEYPNQVRVVWRNFPEDKNPDSLTAAEFAMEAHTQSGKFWQARALLLQHPEKLELANMLVLAKELGLDEAGVKRAIEGHAHGPHLANDGVFAAAFGVSTLPAFFVNGVRMQEPLTLESFRKAVDSELSVAQALVDHGIAAQNVYAEVTKDGIWNAPGIEKRPPGL